MLAIVYESDLAPTVHTIEVADVDVTEHCTPSIVITGVPASRLVPVRVREYPPEIIPYLGEMEVTIPVLSCLN